MIVKSLINWFEIDLTIIWTDVPSLLCDHIYLDFIQNSLNRASESPLRSRKSGAGFDPQGAADRANDARRSGRRLEQALLLQRTGTLQQAAHARPLLLNEKRSVGWLACGSTQ